MNVFLPSLRHQLHYGLSEPIQQQFLDIRWGQSRKSCQDKQEMEVVILVHEHIGAQFDHCLVVQQIQHVPDQLRVIAAVTVPRYNPFPQLVELAHPLRRREDACGAKYQPSKFK